MEQNNILSDSTGKTIWQQLAEQHATGLLPANFHITIEQNDRHILLDIQEHPPRTAFSSYVYSRNNYRFAICPQGFIDEIGKFFGMQDVVLGYTEFDEKYIIKTNDEARTAVIFADPAIRETLVAIPDLELGLVEYALENAEGKAPFLELNVKGPVTELAVLELLYNAFVKILLQLES